MLTTYNVSIKLSHIDSKGNIVHRTVISDDDPVLQHLRYSEDVALDRILQGECAHLGAWSRYHHAHSQAGMRLYVCVQCGMYKMLAEELELE